MLKKIISSLLILGITLSTTSVGAEINSNTKKQDELNAQQEIVREEISSIFDQKDSLEMKILLSSNQGEIDQFNYEIKEIEKHLNKLNVFKMSKEEVDKKKNKDQNDTMMMVTPSDTSTVDWWSYRHDYYAYSTLYDIEDVYAKGKSSNSVLGAGKSGVVLHNNPITLQSATQALGSIYAQKALGYVNVVKWLPYELLFSGAGKDTQVNSVVVNYFSLDTVCFSYVKVKSSSDSTQELSFVSNKTNIASAITSVYVDDYGNPKMKTTVTESSIIAEKYQSSTAAMNNYFNSSNPDNSYVSRYEIKDVFGNKDVVVYLSRPFTPAQVY